MPRYGLIGYPLSHSRSKDFFDKLFLLRGYNDCSYENFSFASDQEVIQFLEGDSGIWGLNFTSPYKRLAYSLCDELSEEAVATGAVNCMLIREGKRYGFNTDVLGFINSISPLLKGRNYASALILGSGGAASAANFGLHSLGIAAKMIGRRGNDFFPNGYNGLSSLELSKFDIIVNCTPLGTFPNIAEKPLLPYEGLHRMQLLFDMVYNPEVTAFMNCGLSVGCVVKNGFEMLELQALKSWEIWRGII
jgi:shikimate dehydrogenase